MKGSQISYLWKNPDAARNFAPASRCTATPTAPKRRSTSSSRSLHSDGFWGHLYPTAGRALHSKHAFCKSTTPRLLDAPAHAASGLRSGKPPDRRAAAALQPLVSITDHDDIEAPQLLRTVASARHIPVSVEWTTPFGSDQSFHLGIHNLPSASGCGVDAPFSRRSPPIPATRD